VELPDWIRATIWRSPSWREGLDALCQQVAADSLTMAPRAADLAAACELIDPDQRRAIDMHVLSWRLGGDRRALDRAYVLAWQLGDLDVLGALATAAFEKTGGAEHAITAAHAFIDRGIAAQAEPFLVAAIAKQPSDEASALLAVIRQQIRDPQAEVATWAARAGKATGTTAAARYMQASRVARLAGLDALATRHVETAWKVARDPAAAVVLAQELLSQRRADELVAFYRARVESTRGDREWFDEMRSAAFKLIIAGVQRGLAHRMLRSALEAAYRARLTDIAGHLACWEVLVRQARESHTGRELMPLVVEAMERPLGDDERLYLARLGFEISWRDAHDINTAEGYAAVIARLSPDDPLLVEFASTALASPAEVAPPLPTAPPAVASLPSSSAAPTLPTVRIHATPQAAISALRAAPRRVGVPTGPPSPANAIDRARRIVVPIDVEVEAAGTRFAAVVRDVSTTGVFLLTERELPMSLFAKLVMRLPTRGSLDVVCHTVTAKVVRRTDSGYGMLLLYPEPALVAAIEALL
jgi:hypothetical protein